MCDSKNHTCDNSCDNKNLLERIEILEKKVRLLEWRLAFLDEPVDAISTQKIENP